MESHHLRIKYWNSNTFPIATRSWHIWTAYLCYRIKLFGELSIWMNKTQVKNNMRPFSFWDAETCWNFFNLYTWWEIFYKTCIKNSCFFVPRCIICHLVSLGIGLILLTINHSLDTNFWTLRVWQSKDPYLLNGMLLLPAIV